MCEFVFKCPRVWDRLQPTAVREVRHCPECRRDVYLALTEADVQRHRDKGRCVAVPMVLTAQETDENPPLAIGMLEARYGTNGDDAPCNGWNGHQSRDLG